MKVEAAHGNESGPGCGMRRRRIRIVNERDLGRAKGANRIAPSDEAPVQGDEETLAERVIDVPEAGHDERDACREEGPAQTQWPLHPRHLTGRRSAGRKDDRTSPS